ncbi:hypothetical protein GWO43_12500 [candidate division KSB1 bacterium]|nr:hypothetical protein [candidate division KSB1 bacterium]NIS24936.1 hypothetical protein [candidate division KSB1 bacterium]NIT71682.1 hypothetical protein [candidate division KSB1 bacterium]NIU25900.1 hypothetical protein [candidate division KSB1 bacterium]NIU92188.1 hypothetical protein [candidate division KSB1 bacterium]
MHKDTKRRLEELHQKVRNGTMKLSEKQIGYLRHLYESGPNHNTWVSNALGITASQGKTIRNALLARGLIKFEKEGDNGALIYSCNTEGEKALVEAELEETNF